MPGRQSRYFDAASGVPLHAVAVQALAAAQADGWADPGRLHGPGRRARLLLDAARESMAAELGARPDEISFAVNATQALHAAVLGTLRGNRRAGSRFAYTAVEHSAVLHAASQHRDGGGTSQQLRVDSTGRLDLDEVAALPDDVAAIAVQAGNHEVGTRQPVAEVAELRPNVPRIVDAAQTLGHAPLPAGWSVLVGDARMWGGGDVAVLAVRNDVRWRAPTPEDDREYGRIPGVPAVAAIVAATAALRAVRTQQATEAARLSELVDLMRERIPVLVPDVDVLGDPYRRLPHLFTFSCLYVDGEALLLALDRAGFAVSSGSSCTSSTLEPSHVLVAMGALTSGNVRVSLHAETTRADVEEFLAILPGAVARVRAELGADGL
jgi:cysteine desulfurase